MRSNGVAERLPSVAIASPATVVTSTPRAPAVCSMTAHCLGLRSTAITAAAPRDSASNEKIPLPAKRSRNRAPAMRSETMLKYACRARSEVGRTSPAGTGTRRPLNVPPVTRSDCIRLRGRGAECRWMDAAERAESFNVSPVRRLSSPSRFRGRLSDEVVGQFALLDEDGGRFREALQHDDALVADDALHA